MGDAKLEGGIDVEKQSVRDSSFMDSKDPFAGLPLSSRQYGVFGIFMLKNLSSVALLYWFGIYATGDDPKALGLSALYLGWLLLAPLFTGLSDIYGRKYIYQRAMALQLLCVYVITFSTLPFWAYICSWFIAGLGFGVCTSLQISMWNEALPLRMLNRTSNILCCFYGLGVPPILYFWKYLRAVNHTSHEDWRMAFGVAATTGTAHLALTVALVPSVPWLLSQKKLLLAQKYFHLLTGKQLKVQSISTELEVVTGPEREVDREVKGDVEVEVETCAINQRSQLSILKMLWADYKGTLLVGTFHYITIGMTYWGMAVQLTSFLPETEDMEFTLSIMASTEVISSLVAWWLPRRICIYQCFVLLFLLQGVALACLFFSHTVALPALVCCRVVSSALFNLICLVNTAAFPPHLRGTGAGILVNMGRIGSILAPTFGLMTSTQVICLCLSCSICSAVMSIVYQRNIHMNTISAMMIRD